MTATVADVARRLNSRAPGWGLPPLILMTDDDRLPDPLTAIAALPAGSAVVFRHYAAADRESLATICLSACRARGLRLLVAGDPAMARRIGADGVHLPEWLARWGREKWRRYAGADWLVTAAAHSPRAIRLAVRAGVDAVIVSPLFATRSHPGAPSLGMPRFAAWTRNSSLPVYAMGGITARNAPILLRTTAVGIAGIGGLATIERPDRR